MKFKFPLQKVMEHRKTLENIAQRDFQEAAAEHAKQVKIREAMEEQLRQAYDRAFQVQHSVEGSTSEQLKQIHDFILGQKVRIERQSAKIQECDKLVEEKREILREKAVDYKIIEKLREKRKTEFELEMRKKEQTELDEVSILRQASREKR